MTVPFLFALLSFVVALLPLDPDRSSLCLCLPVHHLQHFNGRVIDNLVLSLLILSSGINVDTRSIRQARNLFANDRNPHESVNSHPFQPDRLIDRHTWPPTKLSSPTAFFFYPCPFFRLTQKNPPRIGVPEHVTPCGLLTPLKPAIN